MPHNKNTRKFVSPTARQTESVRHNNMQQLIERVLERRHDMLVMLK